MITYAGVPLLIDIFGSAEEFLQQHAPLEDLQPFGREPVALASTRMGTRGDNAWGVGLPKPNYTAPPPIRFNQLYWPTGASRWARFYGVADRDAKQFIVSNLSQGKASLQMGDERAVRSLSTEMYLLPPRPIAAALFGGASNLWIIPLVDARFYWQLVPYAATASSLDKDSTWADAFALAEDNLGFTVDKDSISSAYLIPDPTELTRYHYSAGVVLDALAHSVGQRIVRQIDGTVQSLNASRSQQFYNENLNTDPNWQLVAGGTFGGTTPMLTPAQIEVSYVKLRDHHPFHNGEPKLYTQTGASGGISGTKKLIASTAFANYTAASEGSNPDNHTKLTSLASQISTDYQAWLEGQYDMTFVGVKPWKVTGFDDWVLWSFGSRSDSGKGSSIAIPAKEQEREPTSALVASTRVQTQPYDFGVDSQLSQDPDVLPLLLGQQHVKVSEDGEGSIGSGDTAGLVDVYEFASGSWSVMTIVGGGDLQVSATCRLLNSGESLEANTWAIIDFFPDNRWRIVSAACAPDG